MRRSVYVFTVFLTLFLTDLSADEITLNNGDRLTGTITRETNAYITMDSDLLGEIRIQKEFVVRVSPAEPKTEPVPVEQKTWGAIKSRFGE